MNTVENLCQTTAKAHQFRTRLKSGTIKERYEALLEYKENFIALDDIKSLNANLKTKEELSNINIEKLQDHFSNHALTNKITKRGIKTLWEVLSVLYRFCKESLSGMCHPSMETIAFILDPTLEKVTREDSKEVQKEKEKKISKIKMRISRSVRSLEKLGLIVVMPYYINQSHFKSRKMKKACYAYAIKPPSLAFHIHIYIKQAIDRNTTIRNFVDSLIALSKNVTQTLIPFSQGLKGYYASLDSRLLKACKKRRLIL